MKVKDVLFYLYLFFTILVVSKWILSVYTKETLTKPNPSSSKIAAHKKKVSSSTIPRNNVQDQQRDDDDDDDDDDKDHEQGGDDDKDHEKGDDDKLKNNYNTLEKVFTMTRRLNISLVIIFVVLNVYLVFGEGLSVMERINYVTSALFFTSWLSLVFFNENQTRNLSYLVLGLAILLGLLNMMTLIWFDNVDKNLPILLLFISFWYSRVAYVNLELNSFSYHKVGTKTKY